MKKFFLIISIMTLLSQANIQSVETKPKLSARKQKKLNIELLRATSAIDFEGVKKLLNEGADINAKVSGKTALMIAAAGPYKKIVELLLNEGANPFIKDDYGKITYDKVLSQKETYEKTVEKQTSTDIKEKLLKIIDDFTEEANLLNKYQVDYKNYLNQWRRTSSAILTTSILPLLQKQVGQKRLTQEEFNEIKEGLRPIPRDVVKLIYKEAEPTYEEWFNKIRKK